MTPDKPICCEKCKTATMWGEPDYLPTYAQDFDPCEHCPCHAVKQEVCGEPYYAYAYTPDGDTDTVTQYCEEPKPCPIHDVKPVTETEQWGERFEQFIYECCGVGTPEEQAVLRDVFPDSGRNLSTSENTLKSFIRTELEKAERRGYQAGLDKARECVPLVKDESEGYHASEACVGCRDDGYNNCREETLAALEAQKGTNT